MIHSRRLSANATPIAHGLARDGVVVLPDAVSPQLVEQLAFEARSLWENHAFSAARIGSGPDRHLAPAVRADRIVWLDEVDESPGQHHILGELETLRLAINETAFLGLFEWEGHFACYPPGAQYVRHLDVFAHASQRRVSTVLYLNEGWAPGDGGELRIWTTPAGPNWTLDSPTITVEPRAGTLVTFLSEDYYHEVLPARVDRFSLTGWFRTR